MASTFDRTLYLEELTLTQVNVPNLYLPATNISFNSSLPSWFINNTDVNGYSNTWSITPPYAGTFTYNVELFVDEPPRQAATLTLNVADKYYNINNCCSVSNINITWLGRQGRGNYIFTQRQDTGVDTGEAKTFISDGILKYSDRGRNYNRKIVYATGLSQIEVDYLDTLRYSIQAWIFNENGNTFTPIILDNESFTKYTTKNNMYEVVISFRYATELNVQYQ